LIPLAQAFEGQNHILFHNHENKSMLFSEEVKKKNPSLENPHLLTSSSTKSLIRVQELTVFVAPILKGKQLVST
jgi:hypothetical protein